MTGMQATHVIYRGSVPALNDVVAGHIDFMFCDFASALGMLQGGKVRPLGVTTAARIPAFQDIPPINEAGVAGYDVAAWFMVVTTGKSPPPVVDKLHGELKTILAKPEVKEQIDQAQPAADGNQIGGRDAGLREVGDRALGQGGGGGRHQGIAIDWLMPEQVGNLGKRMGMPERCPAVNDQTPGGVMIVLVRCVAVMAAIVFIQNVSARADDYPNRPVTLIVPWAPAGAVDTVARIIAPKMSERLGKPVVIENRGGAGSTLGTAICGQGRAGRLHARYARQRLDGGRTGDVQAVALRSHQGFRADGADRPRAVRADRQCGAAGQDGRRS